MGASCYACVGGNNMKVEIQRLQSDPQQIIVGTPGRVFDMITRKVISCTKSASNSLRSSTPETSRSSFSMRPMRCFREVSRTKFTIFSELFLETSRYARAQNHDFNRVKQVVLLSATMPVEILDVTKRFMREPIRILVKKEELTLEGIKQYYVNVEKEDWKVNNNFYGLSNF